MRHRFHTVIGILLIACVFALPASAYVGPGVASGALGSLIGGVVWLGMLVMGTIWFPIRNAIGRIKKKFEKP